MEVKHAFTVLRNEHVEIYQRTNSLRSLIGGPSDYVAAIGVPTENHIGQVFPSEQVDHIRYMRRKINSGTVEMRAFTQTRKSWRKHLAACVLKTLSYSFPTPCHAPCTST
jgi:hypothetical protein